MRIRALTIGTPLALPLEPARLQPLAAFAQAVRSALQADGLEVQSLRLATPPLSAVIAASPTPSPQDAPDTALALARALDPAAAEAGFEYYSLGPVRAVGPLITGERSLAEPLLLALPSLVREADRGFFSAQVATRHGGIDLPSANLAARAVVEIADTTEGGFGNLRFAVTANCPPHIPFFPAAYHEGPRPALSIALEAADLAVAAFTGAPSLEAARTALVTALQRETRRIESLVGRVIEETGVRAPLFAGIDYSLAPFPEQTRSIAAAIEALGADAFGGPGTLFCAALLTSTIASFTGPRLGFSGLMLPLLEDSTMAERAAEGLLSVESLLLYSAVCGLGLDTVPLPGDVTSDEISGILLDVAALAVRLDKPLTARLLPVPGKQAGDWTEFDFPYFANTRVLPIRRRGCRELLQKGGVARL